MFVREKLSFERSKDPKAAMELGLKQEVAKLYKSIQEMYDNAYSETNVPYKSDFEQGHAEGSSYAYEEVINLFQKLSFFDEIS